LSSLLKLKLTREWDASSLWIFWIKLKGKVDSLWLLTCSFELKGKVDSLTWERFGPHENLNEYIILNYLSKQWKLKVNWLNFIFYENLIIVKYYQVIL
jgi:hypothetical protein